MKVLMDDLATGLKDPHMMTSREMKKYLTESEYEEEFWRRSDIIMTRAGLTSESTLQDVLQWANSVLERHNQFGNMNDDPWFDLEEDLATYLPALLQIRC